MNPEFLREGNALEDFKNPDRIIIGTDDHTSHRPLEKLYAEFICPKYNKMFNDIYNFAKGDSSVADSVMSFLEETDEIVNAIGTYR
jgi:UDPglucose 6-dehydrogenase